MNRWQNAVITSAIVCCLMWKECFPPHISLLFCGPMPLQPMAYAGQSGNHTPTSAISVETEVERVWFCYCFGILSETFLRFVSIELWYDMLWETTSISKAIWVFIYSCLLLLLSWGAHTGSYTGQEDIVPYCSIRNSNLWVFLMFVLLIMLY